MMVERWKCHVTAIEFSYNIHGFVDREVGLGRSGLVSDLSTIWRLFKRAAHRYNGGRKIQDFHSRQLSIN